MTTSLHEQRVDLACALRWAARLGLQEGVCNHFSLAVADDDGTVRGDRFLINPHGWHWSEITASSLVLCDVEGTVLEGKETVEATAFFIHSRVHLKAPQATCVMHTHMPYATALTLREGGRLEMCEQNALMFYGRTAYDDEYEGLALDASEGDRLAARLGNASTLFLASPRRDRHRPRTSPRLSPISTTSSGRHRCRCWRGRTDRGLRRIPEEVQRRAAQQYATEMPLVAERHFTALRRILDREEPGYRQ